MGTRVKNWQKNKLIKAISRLRRAEEKTEFFKNLKDRVGKIVEMAGKRPNETVKYQIWHDGSYRKVS